MGSLLRDRPSAPRAVWLSVFAVAITMTVFASSASATVMRHANLPRLVEISDIIIQGTVADQKTYFDKAQGRVVTDTTFTVERSFYGDVAETVTIQQWGGELNGKTHYIPGDATFEPGEEVVVFLHRGDGVVALSALGQAKYSVTASNRGKLVFRDLSDMAFLITDENGTQRVDHLSEQPRSLASFVAELESLVAGIKGGDHE